MTAYMKEYVLKKYLENEISVDTLAADLKGSQTKTGFDTISVQIEQMKETGEFQITINHLIRLCDNIIKGDIELIDLNTISFALITSEYFTWDSNTKNGQQIETVIYDWDNQDIGYGLTVDNVKLWKDYLLTGNYSFNTNDLKK